MDDQVQKERRMRTNTMHPVCHSSEHPHWGFPRRHSLSGNASESNDSNKVILEAPQNSGSRALSSWRQVAAAVSPALLHPLGR